MCGDNWRQVSPPTGGAFSSSTRNTHAPIQTNFYDILYRRKLCARRGGTTYPAFVRRATWCCFGSSRSFESRSSMAHGSPGRHASRQWDGGGGELVEEGGERFISFISFIAFISVISFIHIYSFTIYIESTPPPEVPGGESAAPPPRVCTIAVPDKRVRACSKYPCRLCVHTTRPGCACAASKHGTGRLAYVTRP